MNFASRSIVMLTGLLCVAGLLFICATPIQEGWNNYDLIFCAIIPLIAVWGMAMCILSKSYLKFGLTDIIVIFLYGYFIIRYFTDSAYPAESLAIHATLAFSLYFSLRLVFTGSRFDEKTVIFLILVFTGYEAGYGIVQLISGASRHDLYPVTGSFNNPGPYSACIAMGFVIICTYIRYPKLLTTFHIPKRYNLIVSIGIQILALILAALIIITVSRTAIVAIALCLFILFRRCPGRWKWLAVGACLAIGWYLYSVKSGSADGRMVINNIGAYAIADHPLWGSGVGSFFHRIAETTQTLAQTGTNIDLNSMDVIGYAFNDWLQITVELGIVGFLLVGGVVICSLSNLWKTSLPLFLALLVIVVFSFLSYPMELLPYRILTLIIISFSASKTKLISKQVSSDKKAMMKTIATALAFVGISMIPVNCIKSLIKAENDYNMMRGIDDPALIKYYAPLFPLLGENCNFLFDYGRILAKAGRYNDSNDILRRGSMISNDPMFLTLQGNNYRYMGAIDEAERMYLKAWHTVPNRIYPLYRLMILYDQTDNCHKAMEYARIIVDFSEKIPSPAVRDIKSEAQEILYRSLNKQ